MTLDFIAIDFETANRFHGSPCQVGLALVAGSRIQATWGSLMRPPPPHDWFSPDCTEVHGIAECDLTGQPSFERLWPEIESRIAGRPVVAHNAAFDISVIRDATSHCGFDWPTLDFACSLLLARRHYDIPTHTLDAVTAAAEIPMTHHHDAVHDAIACADIVLDMAQRTSASSLDELLRVSGIAWGKLGPGNHEPCHSTKSLAPPAQSVAPTLF
ncbi:MAG: exonuclease domain-containing protein [Arachnia sp.]